jgi:chromosome partitioning protein
LRRIAIINQKGGVGKTTTTANLGAALAIQGRRVVVVDMDAQANLSLSLGIEAPSGTPTSYTVLTGASKFADAIRATAVPRLSIVPANLDLSGAELELAAAMGREFILRDALREWSDAEIARTGRAPADYVLFDCPPSLGLLSINALATAGEVLITMQTEFLALQGMSKLVEVVQLLKKRLNPELVVTGIVPCLYDSRLRLAREVLGEIRTYFRGQVFPHPVRANVKLAEAPSFGQTVFEYAPDSNGADDYMRVAREVIARESRDTALGALPPFDERARLPLKEVTPARNPPPRPPPRKPALKDAAAKDAAAKDAATKDAATKDTAAKETAAKETAAKEMAAKHAGPQVTEPKASKSGSAPSNGTAAASAVSKPAETRAKMPTPKTPSTTNRAPDVERSTTADSPQPTASVRATPSSPREVSARAEHDTIVPRAPVARPQARPEPRVLRAEDVPPLPPDAFEILSILPTDT